MFRKVNPLFRVLCGAGGLSLLIPGVLTDVIGLVVVVAVGAIQLIENRTEKHKAAKG